MSLRTILRNLLKKNKEHNLPDAPTSNNKNTILAAAIVTSLIVIVLVMIISLRNVEKKRTLEESIQASAAYSAALEESLASPAAESSVAEEIKMNSAREDYDNLQKEYDSALKECNKAIKEYNSFLTDIEEFSIEGLPGFLDLALSSWPSFEDYYQAGADRNQLMGLVDSLVEKAEMVEIACKNVSLIAYNVAINDYNTIVDAYCQAAN